MTVFFIYLIKASAGITTFFLLYYFFLRGEANLLTKRFFLLAGLIFSFTVPAIQINLNPGISKAVPSFFIDLPGSVVTSTEMSPGGAISYGSNHLLQILFLLYSAGFLILLARTLLFLIKWNKVRAKSVLSEGHIYYSGTKEVFSLFHMIHLPMEIQESDEHHSILSHERAHIRQKHYVDLLFCELAVLLTWFNPFTWLIVRMIKENHEHLADREVLTTGTSPAHYRAHLLNQTLGVRIFRLGHSFNHSLTKKRFEMMKNLNPTKRATIKSVFIVALSILLISAINVTFAQEGKVTGKIIFPGNDPAIGVSIVVKGTTSGTTSDMAGEFEIMVPGKSELVFSFVGYETVFLPCKPGDRIKLEMKRKVYDLDSPPKAKNDNASGPGSGSEKIPVQEDPEEVFFIVEEMPAFPGGETALKEYIYSNLEYPPDYSGKIKSGKVIIQFLVNSRGQVKDVTVVKPLHPELDQAAIKVIESLPDWKPGKQRNKPVSVLFTVPVNFVEQE